MKLDFKIVTALILILAPAMITTASGVEDKEKGLQLLHSGETGSALYFLNQARLSGLADGEVLGGLALGYFLEGDAQRALTTAEEARRNTKNPSADAYLAGILANEQLGNVTQRDRWIEASLDAFPGDYLLLYHAGRIAIPFDHEKGENLLLKSIIAMPGFPAAHLLLGQSMYRRGENLKAALPLLYYLMLEHDGENSPEQLRLVEQLFNTWAISAPSISRVTRISPGLKSPFVPTPLGEAEKNEKARLEWTKSQITNLMKSMQNVEVTSNDAMWTFYTDFFNKVASLQFAEPMAMHVMFSRYRADVMQWMIDNSRQYQLMADWLLVQ